MSATTAPPAPTPVKLPRPAILPRLISAFSGTTGLVVKIVLLSHRQRVRGLGDLRARRRRATGSAVVVLAARDGPASTWSTSAAAQDAAAEVPHPGHRLPGRLPGHPDPLHDQRRLHELLDRPHRQQGRRDHADQGDVAPAAGERQVVHDGGRPGLEREPRPDPPGRHDDEELRRHAEGADAAAAREREDRRARDHLCDGLHDRHGQRAVRARQDAADLHRPGRHDRGGDPSADDLDRGRAAADAPLRREARRLRPHLGRRGLPRQRQGRVRPRRRGARAGLEDGRRHSRTSRASINDPLVQQPFLRVLIWTIVFAASTVLFSFAIGLFLAIALDKRGLRFQQHLPVDPRDPVRDPGLPLAARLAGAAERPVRRRQPDLPHPRPVAVRRELGEGVVSSSSARG